MEQVKTEIELKEGDVFAFIFNEEETKKRFEPYHCFDGQLVATRTYEGRMLLIDTYWHGGDNKSFTLERAQALGILKFKCNMNEVTEIKPYERDYFADDDIIVLSRQHGCYPVYAVKTGTQRSKDKMLAVLSRRIEDANQRIRSAEYDVKRYSEKIEEVTAAESVDKIYL